MLQLLRTVGVGVGVPLLLLGGLALPVGAAPRMPQLRPLPPNPVINQVNPRAMAPIGSDPRTWSPYPFNPRPLAPFGSDPRTWSPYPLNPVPGYIPYSVPTYYQYGQYPFNPYYPNYSWNMFGSTD